MSTYYTAVIKIHKSVKEPATNGPYARDNKPEVNESTEVASIVVRADSLEKLVEKANAHIALVEE